MFKFYGEVSEQNKKIIINKQRKIFFCASIIPVLLGVCITIILAIKIHLIYLLFLIPLLFFLIIPFMPLSKRTLDLIIPTKIIIYDDFIISEGNKFKCVKKYSDIKSIIDYGSYYFIYFKWPKKSYKFLCQKNLLIAGRIEDFEKYFQSKLSKKS